MKTIKLSQPRYDGKTSLEKALHKRRSVREFKNASLTLVEISQLLWAAQGITEPKDGLRTTPSAGALYPLEVYVVAGSVKDLPAGIYKYKPQGHELVTVVEGDKRNEIYDAAIRQSSIKEAAACIVFSAVYERTSVKYGGRTERYVHIEVGHAAENVSLQAVALNLGTVVIGAFHDEDVRKIMNMPEKEKPLYIMPVGREKG
ncbi:MAG: SagB/ThcOx family dehydrogenase [Bacteroidota bacterium]